MLGALIAVLGHQQPHVARGLQVGHPVEGKFLGTKTSTRWPTCPAEGRQYKDKIQYVHLGKHNSIILDPEKLSTTQTRLGRVQTSPEDIQHGLH